MRHGNVNRKFGRESDQRRALLRSLAVSLLEHGHIMTTEAKAKEIRPLVEKLITRGKDDTLANRRVLQARLGDIALVSKLVKTAEHYKTREGGYLRITKMGPRKGDASPMAVIEFV